MGLVQEEGQDALPGNPVGNPGKGLPWVPLKGNRPLKNPLKAVNRPLKDLVNAFNWPLHMEENEVHNTYTH